ncbi:transmembrane and coiled-coil domain protein 3 [Denticeps clupeoides]|uniref:Transmembrane and coiled-coil domain family 3 n=1 Tax=Denticeps clupeoides TaxID=299321 RepID=A0AAY4DRP1_9TELE|nr:transmembrane and coiled-coil domain protein 3 [Denticeps clupeoides]
MAERSGEGGVLGAPALLKGASEPELDCDGAARDSLRARPRLDSLQQKVLKVTEQLKIEQTARDENVAEYLKLVNNADKQQLGRIRQVFEKKNQKSAQTIVQLQKKLEQYHRKLRERENGPKQPSSTAVKEDKSSSKDSLKDFVITLKHPSLDKVKTVGPGVSLSSPFFFSKPREFANLIRNKFGSADNIAHLKNSMETTGSFQAEGAGRTLSGSATITPKSKYMPSDDECSTGTSVSADSNGHTPAVGSQGAAAPGGGDGEGQGEASYRLVEALQEVREVRESQAQLAEDMEALKAQLKRDYGFITQTLQEERYRYERLEDQLNDLTELHQNETAILKQELASIEEKVAYQAYERARDIQEVLESCQTRVFKLELQQQQQQIVQLESADAKVLLGKCINIMLAIVTVILVCVSTAAKFTAPLMRSRLHVLGTFLTVCALAAVWKNWEQLHCAVERMLLPT